jgi:hypothetical protein
MLIKIPRVGMQLMIKYPTYARPPLWGLTLIGALHIINLYKTIIKIIIELGAFEQKA